MKKYILFALSIAFLCSFSSCNNDEGPGGKSTLQGYVYLVMHNDDDFSLSADTIPAAKTDVFITYGSDKYFGDDVETGPDGFYQFEYLNKGNYTVFSYSSLPDGSKEAVAKTAKLGSNETVTAENIYIHDGKAYATSMIRGKIIRKYFDRDNGQIFKDDNGNDYEEPAGDIRVYLQRMEDDFYIDDVRASNEGVYIFQKLTTGTYKVYAYSDKPDKTIEIIEITNIEVSKTGVVVEIPETLVIYDNL